MKKVIILFFSWLFIINLFAVLGNNRLNLLPDTSYSWIDSKLTSPEKTMDIVSLHAKWDSYWYMTIAEEGYNFRGENQLSNIVFFPLYPYTVKLIGLLTGLNFVLAGWVVSTIFALLSVVLLYKLVKEFHPDSDPLVTIFLLLIFPTAFFLNAVYTESMFLFFSIASFYFTLKKKYILASVFGLCGALTRLTGLLLFLPLLVEYFQHNKKSLFNLKAASFLLIPFGTFLFFLYHLIRFGDFFLFLKVQSFWGRGFNLNENHFALQNGPALSNVSLDIFFTIFSLIVTFFVLRKLRFSYGLYMLLTILIPLSSGTFMSIGRYILILFPIYILGASIKDKVTNHIWILISALLLALYTIQFVNHYWAG